ncbi:MAG: hypothetical protein AB8B84_06735 [Granulosicoccus sp.]
MYSCKCAVLTTCLVVISLGKVSADDSQTRGDFPAYLDWGGSLSQVESQDGSTINEYIAQTESVNVDGARLIISMMPRFSCEPMISTIVSDPDIIERVSVVDLKMTVDDETFDFPSIVDWEKSLRRISLNAEPTRHELFRQALDLASWATFEWSVNNVVDSGISEQSERPDRGTFDFSLLGSRRTVQEMQEVCLAHAPVPYDN